MAKMYNEELIQILSDKYEERKRANSVEGRAATGDLKRGQSYIVYMPKESRRRLNLKTDPEEIKRDVLNRMWQSINDDKTNQTTAPTADNVQNVDHANASGNREFEHGVSVGTKDFIGNGFRPIRNTTQGTSSELYASGDFTSTMTNTSIPDEIPTERDATFNAAAIPSVPARLPKRKSKRNQLVLAAPVAAAVSKVESSEDDDDRAIVSLATRAKQSLRTVAETIDETVRLDKDLLDDETRFSPVIFGPFIDEPVTFILDRLLYYFCIITGRYRF